jgi:hypothetical protein
MRKKQYRSIDDDWNLNPKFNLEQDIDWIRINCGRIACWDFNSALGDTIKEKYEQLMVTVRGLTAEIAKELEKPKYFWLAIPPNFIGVLDCLYNITRQYPAFQGAEIIPMGGKDPQYLGILMNRWRVYSVPSLEKDIVIGCGEDLGEPKCYARIALCNFII